MCRSAWVRRAAETPHLTACPLGHPAHRKSIGNSLAYDPQCLRRDISPWLLTIACNNSTVNYALAAPDFFQFNIRLQGGLQPADIRLHGGGHIAVGGNTGYVGPLPRLPDPRRPRRRAGDPADPRPRHRCPVSRRPPETPSSSYTTPT